MMRWTSLVLGAATFLAAHAIERAAWQSWFGPANSPWFLNSGRAVAFTTACILVAGVLAGVFSRDRDDALVHGGNVAAGAVVAMAVVLFLGPGPGTIFPIVLVIGTVIVAMSSFAGTLLAFPFKAKRGGAGDGR
jgi:hypothetical protein